MVSQTRVEAIDKKCDLLESVIGRLLHAMYEERSVSREKIASLFMALGVEVPERNPVDELGDV